MGDLENGRVPEYKGPDLKVLKEKKMPNQNFIWWKYPSRIKTKSKTF